MKLDSISDLTTYMTHCTKQGDMHCGYNITSDSSRFLAGTTGSSQPSIEDQHYSVHKLKALYQGMGVYSPAMDLSPANSPDIVISASEPSSPTDDRPPSRIRSWSNPHQMDPTKPSGLLLNHPADKMPWGQRICIPQHGASGRDSSSDSEHGIPDGTSSGCQSGSSSPAHQLSQPSGMIGNNSRPDAPIKKYKYEPILPPCQVCGDNASGYHYGANTCEACKAFFRRALQRKTKFKCVTSGNCEVRQGRGFACAYCRFQRCNQLGMSLTAIKRGRYTHAKKAENIREVKRLQQTGYDEFEKKPGIIHGQLNIIPSKETVSPTTKYGRFSPSIQIVQDEPSRNINEVAKCMGGNQMSNVTKLLRCRQDELQVLINDVADNHKKCFGDLMSFQQMLPSIESKYLDNKRNQESGSDASVPDYEKMFNESGLDINAQQELVVEKLLPNIQENITKLIQFARTLPGFAQLSCKDQVSLVKGARSESWFIGEHKFYNIREGLYTNSMKQDTIDMNDMAKVCGSMDVVGTIFRIASRLQQCYLTDTEVTLYKAIAIMQRDRAETEQGAAICENTQMKLMEALQYTVNQNHPNDPTLLARLMMILTDLRSIERQKGEALAKMCMLDVNQKFPLAVLQFLSLTD